MKININRVIKDDDKVRELEVTAGGKTQTVAVWKDNYEGWDKLTEGVEIEGEINEGKKPGQLWLFKAKEKKGFGGGFKPNPRKDALLAAVEFHKGNPMADHSIIIADAEKFLAWLTK